MPCFIFKCRVLFSNFVFHFQISCFISSHVLIFTQLIYWSSILPQCGSTLQKRWNLRFEIFRHRKSEDHWNFVNCKSHDFIGCTFRNDRLFRLFGSFWPFEPSRKWKNQVRFPFIPRISSVFLQRPFPSYAFYCQWFFIQGIIIRFKCGYLREKSSTCL